MDDTTPTVVRLDKPVYVIDGRGRRRRVQYVYDVRQTHVEPGKTYQLTHGYIYVNPPGVHIQGDQAFAVLNVAETQRFRDMSALKKRSFVERGSQVLIEVQGQQAWVTLPCAGPVVEV